MKYCPISVFPLGCVAIFFIVLFLNSTLITYQMFSVVCYLLVHVLYVIGAEVWIVFWSVTHTDMYYENLMLQMVELLVETR